MRTKPVSIIFSIWLVTAAAELGGAGVPSAMEGKPALLPAASHGELTAVSVSSLFDFQLPWDDASPTPTDLSFLNHRPAGVLGPVRVGPDGHLYTGDQRIRFLGVNFTYRSTIPEHQDAEKIAGRLAKFGVNIVRFHLMDANWGNPQCLFSSSFADTRHLDAAAVDRLDFFIAELKKNGIYSDINLLTGRNFRAGDGLDVSIETMDWKAKQTPAFYDPRMIELQKEYARMLLDRVNPYTGLRYVDDPAIAIVELVNEHGLIHAWLGGLVDTLPGHYAEELRAMWNQHLHEVYGSQDALVAAWQMTTPAGAQMLSNPDFSSGGFLPWNVEQHFNAHVQMDITNEGPAGKKAARLRVTSLGTEEWHVQLNQGNLNVSTGTVYTLSFWAKADRAKTIGVDIGQAHDPWSWLGFSRSVNLTTQWQKYTFTLTLTGSDTNARLNFSRMCDQLATYWFADLSLAPGGSIGLFAGENLDTDSIRLLRRDEAAERTQAAKQEWTNFLWQKEESYWLGLRDYLKTDLGVKSLLMGTIVGTSTPHLMNLFDVIDAHAYWQHPAFVTAWGPQWWIRNTTMLEQADGGTLTDLAVKRVHGKPFSVSEYNHPFPSSFGGEGFYLLSVAAALQDWDAIFAYTYADGTLNWKEDRQNGYFDFQHDPGKMIALAQAALIFRSGGLAPAADLVTVPMSKSQEKELLTSAGAWRLVDARDVGLDRRIALLHRIALVLEGTSSPPGASTPASVTVPDNGIFESDTGQVTWNAAEKTLTLDSERTKGLIGYVSGHSYNLGNFIFRPGASLQNWAIFCMSLLDGDQLTHGARRILLTAHGLVQNTGMTWLYYGSSAAAGFPPPAGVDLTLGSWGGSPVQVEGLSGEFVLPYRPRRVSVWALDATGARKAPIRVSEEDGWAHFRTSPDDRTLWYEIEIAPVDRRR